MTVIITAREGSNYLYSFEEPHVVLVEGKEDQALVAALIDHEGLQGFHVHDMIGKDGWTGKLRAICRVRGFGKVVSLGLVRDADTNGQTAWTSCRTSIAAARLPLPSLPGQLQPGRPSVAVAIIPGVDSTGALEELCLPSFQPERMTCVDGYFQCLASPSASSKAIVQTYLAGLQPSRRDLAVAARHRALDLTHPTFNSLRQLLQEMNSA
jgi:uncharacterized protein DUF3226